MLRRTFLRLAALLLAAPRLVRGQSPLVWDTAQYHLAYRTDADDPTTGRYDRTFPPYSLYQARCDAIIAAAAAPPISRPMLLTDRILIGGCGFGQLVDCFRDLGYTNVAGVDGGPHISDNIGLVTPGTIMLEEQIRGGGQFRARLRAGIGWDEFDWIISESMLEGAGSDNNVIAALNFIQGINWSPGSGNTTTEIHMVVPLSPEQDPGYLWKSMGDWRTLLDGGGHTQANGMFLMNLQSFKVH